MCHAIENSFVKMWVNTSSEHGIYRCNFCWNSWLARCTWSTYIMDVFFQIWVFIFLTLNLFITFLKVRYLSRIDKFLKASFLTQQLPLLLDPTASFKFHSLFCQVELSFSQASISLHAFGVMTKLCPKVVSSKSEICTPQKSIYTPHF